MSDYFRPRFWPDCLQLLKASNTEIDQMPRAPSALDLTTAR
jgi:hypothetical protein